MEVYIIYSYIFNLYVIPNLLKVVKFEFYLYLIIVYLKLLLIRSVTTVYVYIHTNHTFTLLIRRVLVNIVLFLSKMQFFYYFMKHCYAIHKLSISIVMLCLKK